MQLIEKSIHVTLPLLHDPSVSKYSLAPGSQNRISFFIGSTGKFLKQMQPKLLLFLPENVRDKDDKNWRETGSSGAEGHAKVPLGVWNCFSNVESPNLGSDSTEWS